MLLRSEVVALPVAGPEDDRRGVWSEEFRGRTIGSRVETIVDTLREFDEGEGGSSSPFSFIRNGGCNVTVGAERIDDVRRFWSPPPPSREERLGSVLVFKNAARRAGVEGSRRSRLEPVIGSS